MNYKYIYLILILLVTLSACKKEYTPKPIGYNRIDIPSYKYTEYNNSNFYFQYSDLSKIQKVPNKDSLYWFNIDYPTFGATIYCSFLKIKPQTLNQAIEDSYHLAYSHSIKAEGIEQFVYKDNLDRHIGGIMYELDGDVATPIQFFITDSTSNFLRGSLYYNTAVNLDSIRPITIVIKDDIIQLFNTLKFNKN